MYRMCDICGSESQAGDDSMEKELVCKSCRENESSRSAFISGDSDSFFVSTSSSSTGNLLNSDFQDRDDHNHTNQTSLHTAQNYHLTTSPIGSESATLEFPRLRDIRVIGPQDTKLPHLPIWLPPEPEDMEDDVENGDATNWDQPSLLTRLCEDRSVRFKHQFHKAMSFTMNGRFQILVTKLLMSEGILISNKPRESWADILTSLASEAALIITHAATTAAQILNPHASLKVKCIATGLPSQSQLIRGLVFKKNAAHKHMQSKHETPKILLLKGMLGHSSSGLSSFDSMKQENDTLESFVEMIETCRPNVVLVENTVSRDVQESFLAKGITLVSDMKLHRLQRIARYTDSKIFSSDDSLSNQKLQQCQSLYFEKFVEEHSIPRDGGKKPIKTLMLLEGCHRPLGCTVLLKGTHNNELKKIKNILHSAVVIAYHLILETSFLVDHKEMLSTIPSLTMDDFAKEHLPIAGPSISQNTSLNENLAGTDVFTMDSPSSNGSGEAPVCEGTLHKSMDSALHGASLPSVESIYRDVEIKDSFDVVESLVGESPGCEVPVEFCTANVNDEEDQIASKDSVNAVLDAQSILYLVSSRSIPRKPNCNQSRLRRVEYYKSFDVSLGEFLHAMLDQTYKCPVCSEAHEAHVYNYVNQSGKLTVQVKNLSGDLHLPGEAEGKLWMWAQCSECESTNKSQGSTRRVVMSTASWGLSFGKFLELNFSAHSAFKGLSGCGHSHQTDYLRFYGLGSMVAMVSYSPVKIYSACMPPPVLDFSIPIGQVWMQKEAKNVLEKGMLLFTEVMDFLKKIESEICSSNLISRGNLAGLAKRISEVKERLKEEKFDFEVKLQKRMDRDERLGQSVHEFLSLNSSIQELMLESYVWDQRLRSLRSNEFGKFTMDHSHKLKVKEEQLRDQKNGIENQRVEGGADTSQSVSEETNSVLIDGSESNLFSSLRTCNDFVNHGRNTEMYVKLDGISVGDTEHSGEGYLISDHQSEGFVPEFVQHNGKSDSAVDSQCNGRIAVVLHSDGTTVPACQTSFASDDALFPQDSSTNLSDGFPSLPTHDGNHQEQTEKTMPITEDHLQDDDSFANFDVHDSEYMEVSLAVNSTGLQSGLSTPQSSLASNMDDLQDMVWNPFPEIRKAYRMDLQRIGSRKFEFVDSYTPKCLSQANQLLTGKGCRLHIPLGHDDYIVSAYEDEPTSIIACALTLLHEKDMSGVDLVEKATGKGNRAIKSFIDSAPSLDSDVSVESEYWSSNGSLDSQGNHSGESVTSETWHPDASTIVDPENPHREIYLWGRKLRGKDYCSVVCLYEKKFRALRRHCCPCELDYISSLSRCKNWDAKGGKSGALFVKTLDDRFIIKQIQKTEFDSFVEFAPQYFDYCNNSLSSGSQTCLAKILGIYQVTIRQPKGGKEIKYDLMVMENLLYARRITRLYDLKGAEFARYTKDTDGSGKVFMDSNFIEDMDISPLYISLKNKHLLQRAVWNDTSFLTSINVMDYSLLVGVDTERNELVCGIIDYLRQYTWDKHLETWVKISLVVPKNVSPTVVSPKEYKKRFRKFMDLHFLTIPS